MPAPWLITRPLAEALEDVAALAQHGVEARVFPAVELRDLPWDEALRGATLLLLSSASVLDPVARAWARWPESPKIAAIAPTTSARAAALGLPVALSAEGGALALAQEVLARWEDLGAPGITLYPTSDRGLSSPEQQLVVDLLSPRTRVRRVAVVETAAPADLPERLASLRGAFKLVFASPSAVEHLFRASPPRAPEAVLTHGRSTEAAYRRLAPPSWPAPQPAPGATVISRVLHASTQG